MPTDTSVKYFSSAMPGAPVLSGTAGAMIGVLDACLINGFGSVTLDSLVVASEVATATKSAGHNFAMIDNAIGPVVTIAGATPSELNGNWRVTVVSPSQFTFAVPGVSNQTATGTITAKRSPAGWGKAFSDTNKAVYRADDPASTRLFLRVDDTPAQYPTLTMYETMSGVDTGTAPAPTTGSLYFAKSSAAGATARPWILVADSRAFYLLAQNDGTTWYGQLFFGDIKSLVISDAYHCMLLAGLSASYTSAYLKELGSSSACYLARANAQIGAAIAAQRKSNNNSGITAIGTGPLATLNPPDNQFVVDPVDVWDSGMTQKRGWMPGLYNPQHNYSSLFYGRVFPTDDGRALMALQLNNAMGAFDIVGPWR